jgi:hypothetical protein
MPPSVRGAVVVNGIVSVCPGAVPGFCCMKPKLLGVRPVLDHPGGVLTLAMAPAAKYRMQRMLLPSVEMFWMVSVQLVPDPVIRASAWSADFATANGTATKAARQMT